MIYRIAELLRDEISSLNFVEIAAGLAKPHIVRNNVTEEDTPAILDKAIPMAYNDLGITCEEGDLYVLYPNTKKKSIVWWEDNGIDMLEEETYYYQCKASLTCIGWWNLPLINQTFTNASWIVANLIAAIPERLANVDYLSQIRVYFTGEIAEGAEVVSKYDFDEPENQFTTFPYSVTGINFDVDFAFGKNCVDCLNIIPSSCPPKMNYDTVLDLMDFILAEGGTRKFYIYMNLPSGSVEVFYNNTDCDNCTIIGDGTTNNCLSENFSGGTHSIQLFGDYLLATYFGLDGHPSGSGNQYFDMDISVFVDWVRLEELRLYATSQLSSTIDGDISNLAALVNLEKLYINYTAISGDFNVIANFPNLEQFNASNVTTLNYTTAVLPQFPDGILIDIPNMNLSTAEVDQILIDLDTCGTSNGAMSYITGNDPHSAASAAARANLVAKGWALV